VTEEKIVLSFHRCSYNLLLTMKEYFGDLVLIWHIELTSRRLDSRDHEHSPGTLTIFYV